MSRDERILRSAAWHGQAVVVGRPSRTAVLGEAEQEPLPALERADEVLAATVRSDAQAPAGVPERPQPPVAQTAPSVDAVRLEAHWREQGRRAGYEEGLGEGRRLLDEEIEARARALAREQVAKQVAEQVRDAQEKAAQAAEQQRQAEQRQRQSQAQEDARRSQRVEQLAEQLTEAWTKFLEGAEDEILEVVFEAVCRIVGEQAVTREGARAMLGKTLQSWHGRHPLSVHLHPEDVVLLRGDPHGALALASRGFDAERQSLRWVADTDVRMGGCLLRSAEGALDARLEQQLKALAVRLVETRAARRQGATGIAAGEAAA